jgi:regulator of protease activity HflC (stomatin/prohibitin superfamily)
MTAIRRYPFLSQARVEASAFLAAYRNGRPYKSGRGLAIWYSPAGSTSLVEIPADDRDHILQISATTSDFQIVSVQGVATWRAAQPLLLAERIDFSIDPRTGQHRGDPIPQIESLLDGLMQVVVERYVGARTVAQVLDEGVGALLAAVESEVVGSPRLEAIGVGLAGVRLSSLTPSPDLARALRQPTMELLQQAADEATFARRAAAVQKEAAIAENETKAKIRLEQERSELIARERDNTVAQARAAKESAEIEAESAAEARRITAHGEAESILALDDARLKGERERAEIAKAAPAVVVIAEAIKDGLAASEIGTLNLGPDVVGMVAAALKQAAGQAAQA